MKNTKITEKTRRFVAKRFAKLIEAINNEAEQNNSGTLNVPNISGTLYVLNSPILTDYGTYEYTMLSEEEVTELLKKNNFESAVGHQGAADTISTITGVTVPMNRKAITMKTGDAAVVFKIQGRLPEGAVLSKEELKNYNYSFGLLTKKS